MERSDKKLIRALISGKILTIGELQRIPPNLIETKEMKAISETISKLKIIKESSKEILKNKVIIQEMN